MVGTKRVLKSKAMHHCEVSPVTPTGVRAKKLSSIIGKDNDSVTSGEIWEHSDRRITRSISRKMRGKLGYDYGRTRETSQVAIDLFKHSERESRKRRAVQLAGQVRGTSYDMGKDSTTIRRVRQGKQYQLTVNHGKDGEANKCRQIVGNSKRIVTRSASKAIQGKTDLCGQMVERRSTHTTSRFLGKKAEFPKAKKEKLVNNGLSNCHGNQNQSQKRMTRSAGASSSINHEKDGKADECRKIMEYSNMLVTRASKAMQRKTDLCGQMVERESTRTTSRFLGRKAESPKAKKKKLENNGLSDCHGNQNQLQKRMTRSAGASSSINHEKDGKADECQQIVEYSNVLVTRSASKAMQGKTDSCGQMVERRNTRTTSRYLARKAESPKAKKGKQENNGLSNCLVNHPQKSMTRISSASSSIRLEEEPGIRAVDGMIVECHDYGRIVSELDTVSCDPIPLRTSPGGPMRKTRDDISEDPKLIGVKRNRRQTRLQGTEQGWTKEQEVALQNAYFTAKPSPHFWKNVAKLVTGKSAQECFDKVHSNILTPPPARPFSRVKKEDAPSDLSFSGSELFKSAKKKSKKTSKAKPKSHVVRRNVRHLLQKYSHVNQDSETDLFSILEPTVNPSAEAFQLNPVQSTQKHKLVSPQNTISPSALSFSGSELFKSAGKKSKKTGRVKQKSHVARTNVRQLLQKYGHVIQDSEADLFSVLEPTVSSTAEAFQLDPEQTTPKHKLVSPGLSSRCRDSSSLSQKKRLSRFSGASVSPLTSPPVLKKVKNLALHEKYIDQLHMRDAKRKVASARHLKAVCRQKNEENPSAAMKDVIRVAKNALFSDARDAIHKFQHSQANLMETFSDSEELFSSDDEADETTL